MVDNVARIIAWVRRMSAKHGGVVFDYEQCRQWDWGQALCREMYGPKWWSTKEWGTANDAADLPDDLVFRATAWEAGKWPSWARENKEVQDRRA